MPEWLQNLWAVGGIFALLLVAIGVIGKYWIGRVIGQRFDRDLRQYMEELRAATERELRELGEKLRSATRYSCSVKTSRTWNRGL